MLMGSTSHLVASRIMTAASNYANYEYKESQQARNICVWSVARIARVIPFKNGYATRAMSYHLTGRLSAHTLPLNASL